MSKTAVIYRSKYGATKKYAEWIAEDLNADLLNIKKIKPEQLREYDTLVFGGPVYASGVKGASWLKKNWIPAGLADTHIVAFVVGASPYDKDAFKAVTDRVFSGDLTCVTAHYCRGMWNEEKMSFSDKMICKALKSAVSKKDPETYESWESALVEAMKLEEPADWTDRALLDPVVASVKKGRE